MSRKAIRIVAIVLAVLIFIGVLAGALLNTFALEEGAAVVIPTAGERSKILPVVVTACAAIVIGTCLAVPKIKNKLSKADSDQNDEQI